MIIPPLATIIASGFGSGLISRRSPGTLGTVAAVAVWYLMKLDAAPLEIQISCAVAVATLGFLSCYCISPKSEEATKKFDPQWVVIDEWAGVFIALIGISLTAPTSPTGYALSGITAFLLFRLFDITKIGPIRAVEKLPHGIGIMMDDLLAGVFALVVRIALDLFVLPSCT
jgi:phosphatidylglycerophosphatase A